VQTANVRAEFSLRAGYCSGQRLGSGTLWDIADLARETRPLFASDFVVAEGLDGLLGQGAELLVGELLARPSRRGAELKASRPSPLPSCGSRGKDNAESNMHGYQ
jgi:hypothetical protein